ncbi:MAG: TssQ family T6SS-associated lipoprotein [Burkholderiales bacterium]
MKPSFLLRPAAWLAIALAIVVTGCATPPAPAPEPAPAPAAPAPTPPPPPPAPPPPPPPTATSELDRGVRLYEDGDYKAAAAAFQSALAMGLPTPAAVARAHKYLAFMVCVNGREKACRDEFRAALEADPNFALAPAEAGHPVWSQVVKSVKAELAAAAKNKKKS